MLDCTAVQIGLLRRVDPHRSDLYPVANGVVSLLLKSKRGGGDLGLTTGLTLSRVMRVPSSWFLVALRDKHITVMRYWSLLN